jgi:phage tail sheath protein FI
MALTQTTPGVYIQEIPKFPPSIAAVATAIPAFIGYTEKAKEVVDDDLHLKAKRITSLVEYEFHFGTAQEEEAIKVEILVEKDDAGNETRRTGKATLATSARSAHVMYYALQLYFANGGGPCYVVSVDKYTALPGTPDGKKLKDGLDVIAKEDEPTLIVFPEAQKLDIGAYKTLHVFALAQCADLQDRFTIMDLHGGDKDLNASDTVLDGVVKNFRDNGIDADNLKYGAVYAPNIETTIDFVYKEDATEVTVAGGGAVKLKSLSDNDNKSYELAKAAIRDLGCKLPPSGAIAGIYARVDNERGVWKAPANVSVATVIKPTIACSAAEQGDLNVDSKAGKSVNVIRAFTGRGTLVWGARTLAGNDNEWRYINVRRLFIMVEESAKNAAESFTFEPNDANTWIRVQAMIENFLTTLWRQGALQGIKPEHAFYVAVGLGKTMTALDILEGRMIVEIGMAAVRPAEFIILRFSHKMQEV